MLRPTVRPITSLLLLIDTAEPLAGYLKKEVVIQVRIFCSSFSEVEISGDEVFNINMFNLIWSMERRVVYIGLSIFQSTISDLIHK